MYLTALTLRNFKSIGDKPVRVEFKQITLLFGPNSAGKSTIFQALHYLSEILERYNCDPGQTAHGGSLDLGGFQNLVHKHDLSRSIIISVEFRLDDHDYLGLSISLKEEDDLAEAEADQSFEPLSLLGCAHTDVSKVSVELEIRWSDLESRAFVSNYAVEIENQPFGTCTSQPGQPFSQINNLNFSHPMLRTPFDDQAAIESPDSLYHTEVEAIFRVRTDTDHAPDRSVITPVFESKTDALPAMDETLYFHFPDESEEATPSTKLAEVRRALTEGFVSPAKVLRNGLRRLYHLGPLREVPGRNFRPERVVTPSRWASGLAAWDILHRSEQSFVDQLNQFLESKEHLDVGYSIRLKRFREVDSRFVFVLKDTTSLEDFVWIKQELARLPEVCRITLWDEANGLELMPEDLGVGISQLLPIVVAALHYRSGIVSIEQPELHIHPRLQTALADVFIAQLPRRTRGWRSLGIGNETMFLLETHSEHLILRFLRRIRETTANELPPGASPFDPQDLAVYYVEPAKDGVDIKRLRVDETGEFIDRWPHGFFEERAEELF